jgi:hypothetical protein
MSTSQRTMTGSQIAALARRNARKDEMTSGAKTFVGRLDGTPGLATWALTTRTAVVQVVFDTASLNVETLTLTVNASVRSRLRDVVENGGCDRLGAEYPLSKEVLPATDGHPVRHEIAIGYHLSQDDDNTVVDPNFMQVAELAERVRKAAGRKSIVSESFAFVEDLDDSFAAAA